MNNSMGVLRFSIFFLSFYIYVCIQAEENVSKPHIIFIMTDDMGWNDVSFHGSDEIPTPNIDALAYNGVILNRHYVLPICSPSRSALLTGRYSMRDGMQGVPLNPGQLRGIPVNRTLMPEHLRNLGYATHLVGKWHVGYYTEKHTPARRGFDTFYGYYNGYITYFNHTIDLSSGESYQIGNDFHRDDSESLKPVYDSGYFTTLITDEAENIIKNNGNKKPLYLQINHLGCHSNGNDDEPLEIPDKEENDQMFSYIKDVTRRRYAGVMKSLDDSVGRIVTALSDAQMLQDSIIVFISDNGAPTIDLYANAGSNYPLRGIKNTLFEGGVRGSACIFSPQINSRGRVSEEMMHVVDWLPTLYSAAGGDLSDLGTEIDGVNQWPTIQGNAESPRQSMLLNIDEVTEAESAIIDNYKLIKNAVGPGTGYYGESGIGSLFPFYNTINVLSSATSLAINKLPRFERPTETKIIDLRKSSIVRCEEPRIPQNCSNLCLFDVQTDPCETRDLSKNHPEIVEKLESFINQYRKFLISQGSYVSDPNSFPGYFNGTWMPWIKNEI